MFKSSKPTVTVYEPQNGSKKYVKSDTEHPSLDYGPSINNNNIGVVNNDSALAMMLRGNPFLYNSQTTPFKVTSLEEYLIKVKKEEIAFGDVLRNPKFSFRKRKCIIKKAFKTWNKDYTKKKDKAFEENDKVIEVIGEINYLKFKTSVKVILYLLFVVMLFIVGTSSVLWDKITSGKFGYSLQQTIINMFVKSPWLQMVGNITIYLIIIVIFYSTIYTLILRDFKQNYKLAQNFLNRSETTISRSYKKKWTKARRYYLSLLNKKKPYFAPLPIEDVEEGDINISIFNSICQATIDRAYKMKKSKPYIMFLKTVLVFTSIGGSVVVLLFTIINLVISIFK